MKKIDFVITTMDRYHLLGELLDSIFRYYPLADITIADQSKDKDKDFYKKLTVSVHFLPYDCGLSYARNFLIDSTKNPYVLLLEDDFLFTKQTRIEWMLELMNIADIVGGAVKKNGIKLNFEHYFEKKDGTISQIPDLDRWIRHYNMGLRYKPTGCVLNFALFNRRVFDRVRWDERLKLREHQHFFYRVKDKIVYTDDVEIEDNKKTNHPRYKAMKGRDEFWKIALEDLGAKRFKYLTGQVVEIENHKIVRYRQ